MKDERRGEEVVDEEDQGRTKDVKKEDDESRVLTVNHFTYSSLGGGPPRRPINRLPY